MKSRIPIVLTEGGFSVQLEPITGENDSEVCKKGLAMEKELLGSAPLVLREQFERMISEGKWKKPIPFIGKGKAIRLIKVKE